jgi:hypothetical protein
MNGSVRFVVPVLFILSAAVSGAAQALTPPKPPDCVPASSAVTVEALGAVVSGNASNDARRCAMEDLAARGASAVPVAVGLLGTSNHTTLMLALELSTKLGPLAHTALPALMDLIGTHPPSLHGSYHYLYDAVGAIGEAAAPAIPLLILQSGNPEDRFNALRALGQLGRYDADRVVPYLISMLEGLRGSRVHIEAPNVLDALAAIGSHASTALSATLASLEQAKAAGDIMHGYSAVNALVAIGEPGESIPVLIGLFDHPTLATQAISGLGIIGAKAAGAVPALIDKLNRSRNQPNLSEDIVRALDEIAPESATVQQQLLVEATRHGSRHAAYALAQHVALPSEFVPALTAALVKKPGDVFLAIALKKAQHVK